MRRHNKSCQKSKSYNIAMKMSSEVWLFRLQEAETGRKVWRVGSVSIPSVLARDGDSLTLGRRLFGWSRLTFGVNTVLCAGDKNSVDAGANTTPDGSVVNRGLGLGRSPLVPAPQADPADLRQVP